MALSRKGGGSTPAEAWLASKGVTTYEFLEGKLCYVAVPSLPPSSVTQSAHFFSIDTELVYWNFFLDFGPLNLGQLHRFCSKLNAALADPQLRNKKIYFYSGTHPHRRTNAACLICCWAIIYLNQTPEEAYAPFRGVYPPFAPFHDPTPIACTYNLSVYDCLCGLYKAKNLQFFDFESFDPDEYEYYEQVENGDLNWHQRLPDPKTGKMGKVKWLAFAGPHETRAVTADGYQTLTVDDYGPYFKKMGITLVVRLNKKYYDERKFAKYGIRVFDLYYLDGSNPSARILSRFLEEVEANEGGVAVHCKAGLGRTGTCIGCYLMKHYKFTAAEVIGWMRICRPGTVIGPQQHFMAEMEQTMWREGDLYRQRKEAEAQQKQSGSRGKVMDQVSSSMGAMAIGSSNGAAASSSSASRDLKRAKGGSESLLGSSSSSSSSGGGSNRAAAASPKSASGWVDPNQGSNLRAARAAAQAGTSRQNSGGSSSGGGGGSGGGDSSGWARGNGSRLVRK